MTVVEEPSRKDIIRRLFEAGHISFDEMWILLVEDEPETRYVVQYNNTGSCDYKENTTI